jgi:hypothetical protein
MSLAFTSFVFDKPSYVTGDAVSLTVTYTSDDLDPGTSVDTAVTVAVTDAVGTVSQTSDGSPAFPGFTTVTPSGTPMATTVSATDPRPGTWTLVSNSFAGSAAPFDGTAVLSSVA